MGNSKQKVTTFSLSGVTPCQGCPSEWSMAAAINACGIVGKWPVYVEQSGQYEIELRRWPIELDKAINEFKGLGGRVPMKEFSKDAVQISPDIARVKIGDTDICKKINPNEKSIRFKIALDLGPTDLQAWFIDKGGTARVAYWVYVKRI